MDPEKFHTAVSKSFVRPESVHENDYVSYHLYFVILWSWEKGQASESKVHAFVTHMFQKNITEISAGNPDKIAFKTYLDPLFFFTSK